MGQAQPFVKWVGGKRQVLPEILPRIPGCFENYWEAFTGGGAVFYALHDLLGEEEHRFHLSDLNSELVNTYRQVQKNPKELVRLLEHHRLHHSEMPPFHMKRGEWKARPQTEVWYYLVRTEKYHSRDKVFQKAHPDLLQAARFIYLNRTCFNGLYRVNRQGEFNVPAGRYKDPDIVQQNNIAACSKALKKARITQGSYQKALSRVQPGDFVYLDPPYDVWDQTTFTAYSEDGFDWQDQIALADFAHGLKKQGVSVMLSNHATERILDLYKKKGFSAHCFPVKRSVAASAGSRGAVQEVLLMSYAQKEQKDPKAKRIRS